MGGVTNGVDTSISTYELVIGTESIDWGDLYGCGASGMSTGSFQCTAGYNNPSYGGFSEFVMSGSPFIGFVDANGTFIADQNQPAYKIFYNNELIYEAIAGQNTGVDGDSIFENLVGQTVIIKVY